MGKGYGDRLASTRQGSAQFATGGAKVKDKVIFAPGIVASEETREVLDKVQRKAVKQAKPRIKSRLTPLYDKVLVRAAEVETITQGGIIVPDDAKDRPMRGEVLFVGEGRIQPDGTIRPLFTRAGDVVLYGKYSGTEVKVDDEVVLIMKEDDILVIVDIKREGK
jgi:chaperonin GroES